MTAIRTTPACTGLLIALCAVWAIANADGQAARAGVPAASEGSVSVARYCEDFARAYCEKNAIDYADLSVQAEKKRDLRLRFANAFQPPDSRFTAAYDCRFGATRGNGQVHKASVGIFLTATRDFANYTKWERQQLVPVAHVVDEANGRAGYGVFKYLRTR